MSVAGTLTTVVVLEKTLEAANMALQIGMELQQRSAELAKLHAEGTTLSDEALQQHMADTQALIGQLKAVGS